MSGLRSRWTVVALVPAFFLAGFGIVSELVDSPDSEPSVPSGSTIDLGGASGTEGGRTAPSTSPTATAQTVPTVDLGLAEGGGDGEAPPASAPGAIEIE